MITTAMIQSEVAGAYEDPNQQKWAEQAYGYGLEWVNNQPKTWCDAQKRESRKEARRERQKKRKELHEHINSQMGDVRPVGFIIPSIIFFAILSGIISWVVQRILSHYWPED